MRPPTSSRSQRLLSARWLLATAFPLAAVAEAAEATESGDRKRTIAQVQFNAEFLKRADGTSVDVSRFARGNPVTAGDYPADIYLNGMWIGRDTVRLRAQDEIVAPCMDRSLLPRLNLDESALPPVNQRAIAQAMGGDCIHPSAIADDITWTFSVNDLRLDFSVAQALMRQQPRGSVHPAMLDDGVPSATAAYNLNTFHTGGPAGTTTTYLGLDTGLNLGPWHVRQRSSMTWQSVGQRYDYQNIATYVQRDVPALRSQFTLGDAYTDGAIFDSFSLRGANLASDDRMLPDSSRGYAPLVRGVARSNARVTVSQNGNKLYETTVAPGPFEIKDLYATGYGGNLLVTVTEADGSESSFTVPYASVVQLLRPGITRYSVAAGEYRAGTSSKSSTRREKLMQGTVQHGFSNLLTGYAGLVLSEGYQAGLLGAAFNLPVGAFALDITHANASIPAMPDTSGQSMRISYSKFVPTTGTNMTIAAYRYATRGYWSMRDAFAARDGGRDPVAVDRQRSQVQVTLNQGLNEGWGNFYATGTSAQYWNRGGTSLMFQLGYSNTMRVFGLPMHYNLAVSRQREAHTGRFNTQVSAFLSVPLGKGNSAPLLSLGATQDRNTHSSQQMRLSGSALEDGAITYGLSADRTPARTTGGGNIQYRTPYATVAASVSGGGGYTQYSGGLQGALVAHPGGLTLANFLGDTIGIVEAKGATGARVVNAPGVRIDPFGYAIVPYLQPYNMNTVELDVKGLPLDVSLDATSTQVAPRANAAVKIRFAAVTGRSAIVSATRPDGTALPFGATVTDEKNAEVGIVGQSGIVFARGIEEAGKLTVTWGDRASQRCSIDVRLPPRTGKETSYPVVRSKCLTEAKEP
ncbi:fimbria/pilus outer membrane usher protein [Cupriavidus sp.]|uniref:fimbria/pilus outer membrane usher protein n=1 Tax=Cupriavidus sp. TaxID=1873897 RepID=UPI0025BBDF74|nr:fimbria/pilus outer membrane usher protein [Cupriavidus sp.]MCA3183125.1 fimbrial biogenesis outer membrane usher protein [Cupriavidus sp.]MCA3192529.1 fimbrial biogenesis outer membrane usher protein [Cupriavidus sp.]MCA3200098.1 fimbrial biogenesis outer membrane usher protein [Cupriavidus sp.]MCA3203517.1 fimbrial biogenesis outer membrane usher protein [Cupriavidus sp.]MCA3208807.1 fimbrial biogenesis outer membrane usher protein [Cupriavidus sp.]